MKKLISILLSVIMVLSFTACGTKAEASWQEQYDLGVKYVREAKYEEAILAFNKALEIDPKQVDVYIALADVYIRQEDYENAENILNKGYDETGSEHIIDRLNSDKSFSETEVVDDIFKTKQNYIDFDDLAQDKQDAIKYFTMAVIKNDATAMQDMHMFDVLRYDESNSNYLCHTIWSGYKIKVSAISMFKEYEIEIRSESDMGYYTKVQLEDENIDYEDPGYYLASCECKNWQFNGTMNSIKYVKRLGYNVEECTGEVVNNMRQGEHRVIVQTPVIGVIEYIDVYKDGYIISSTDDTDIYIGRHRNIQYEYSAEIPGYDYAGEDAINFRTW